MKKAQYNEMTKWDVGGVAKTSRLTFSNYLIRRNFRADKFSRTFAQNLVLREIARKLVQNFFTFAHKKSQNLNVRENIAQSKCAKICLRESFYE